MKLVSWNVNGVRAAVKKDFIAEFQKSNANIYCLQETKAQEEEVAKALKDITNFGIYSNQAEKKGYSGVTIISDTTPVVTTKNIGIDIHDQEGRVITSEFDKFYVVNVYVPNSGNELKRLDYRAEWDKDFAAYLSNLRKSKPIIVTGDFNVSHKEIDLARPKSNYNKTSGYTQTEIDGMDGLLSVGLIDSFRYLHPDKVQYSFWSVRFGARAKNVGWRLDYFLVDETLKSNIVKAEIHDQIMGSDHCPISLELKF